MHSSSYQLAPESVKQRKVNASVCIVMPCSLSWACGVITPNIALVGVWQTVTLDGYSQQTKSTL